MGKMTKKKEQILKQKIYLSALRMVAKCEFATRNLKKRRTFLWA